MSSAPPPAIPLPPNVRACGYSHQGQKRSENEDAFAVFADERLYVVADGMGGRAAGEIAARLAVDEVETFFRQKRSDPRGPWPFPVDRSVSFGANLLRVSIQVANQKIRAAAARDPSLFRMAATLGALVIGETQLVAAHLGDVRLYRIRNGVLGQLTRDHSLLEEMRAARPDMTPEEIAAAAPRNVVTRALGTKDDVEPTVYLNSFEPGDRYLLCSDGLWSQVDEARLVALCTASDDLEVTCQGLLDAANQAGGADNITAVLVQVDSGTPTGDVGPVPQGRATLALGLGGSEADPTR